jgi:hypothetical protein
MAIQTMLLDPNAASYTDDQIVGKVNSASASITRASSVSAAARPIAALEVTSAMIAAGAIKTKLAGEADGSKLTTSELAAAAGVTNEQVATGLAKTSLDAMTDTARGYVKTSPTSGQFKVIAIQRQADGKAAVTYDDVAV